MRRRVSYYDSLVAHKVRLGRRPKGLLRLAGDIELLREGFIALSEGFEVGGTIRMDDL